MRAVFLSNCSRRYIFLVLLLLLLLLLGIFIWRSSHPVPGPEEIVGGCLNKLKEAHSYTYSLTATSIIDGKETPLTQVEGVWVSPDHYYLRGEALGNPLEAYIFGDVYMIKDPQGEWLEFQGGQGPSLIRETVLFSQDPLRDLGGFHSGHVTAEETIAGQRCYRVEGKLAKVSNPLWQAFWQDFVCQLWVDKKELHLWQLRLNGKSIGSNDRLTVHLEMHDYDTERTITPPQ